MAYSEKRKSDIVTQICDAIIEGSTLRRALTEAELPAKTFYEWIDADDSKSKQYARATELRAEAMAEELLTIADSTEDDVVINPETGQPMTNHNVIQRDRLRVDSRKWLMSKMFVKKYGERVQQDHNIHVEQPLFGETDKKE